MSRFWGGDSSEEEDEKKLSEEEEDEDEKDSEDEDSEEEGEDEEDKEDKEKPDIFQRFLSDDEDEEETKRTVKTQKAKRDDLMTKSISSLKNHLDQKNWTSIQTEFDNLIKIITKFQNVSRAPKRFVKIFAAVEDAIEQDWEDKELRKSMNQSTQKALTTMKQKIKKQHTTYEKELEEYREKKYDSDASLQEAEEEEAEEEQKEEVIKPEDVQRKLDEIIANRGRKNIDRRKILEMLEKLYEISESSIEKVKIMMIHITAYLDQSVSLTTYMHFENWSKACELIHQLIDMLAENPQVIVQPVGEEKEENGKVYISGSIAAFVERLDEEFTKSLQQIDPHTSDYIQRLRDEGKLYYLIVRVQQYYESIGEIESICRCIIKRVEHIYYKNDAVTSNLETQTLVKLTGNAPEKVDTSALINQLCTYLYQHANDRVRPRALMFHVYHHAHSGRFAKARDLLLMSHIQESIQQADIHTQIIFNRTMAQIGLCAFRSGMIKEAQNALYELESSGRAKELLAQGIMTQKFIEKSSEQERLEKLRQVPFHMHINLELLECIFLTCSMILEVPMMSINYESKKSLISKPFKRLLEFSERQDFLGPPENTREHIVQATKALSNGDWEKCVDFIHKIKIWDLMPDVQEIKKMLSSKIQYAGLQTYLLAFSSFYDTLSLEHLSTMFKLPRPSVQSTISKMIINEELHASLDQVAGVVILHRVEPTRLQQQALQFADQIANYMENSERFLSYPYNKDEKLSQKRTSGRPTGRFSTNPQRKTNYRKQEEVSAN